jgi:hypothetical protein
MIEKLLYVKSSISSIQVHQNLNSANILAIFVWINTEGLSPRDNTMHSQLAVLISSSLTQLQKL